MEDKAKQEEEAIAQAVVASRIATDWLQDKESTVKWLKKLVAVLSATLVIFALVCVGCVVWATQNAQRIVDDALWKAMNSAGEITVTTTKQTVEGDSATINNVHGEQYNHNAQKVGD